MARMRIKLNWVPNLFTLANLSLGFFAILLSASSHGNRGVITVAAGFILLAMLCDGLDGFAARLLNASSPLGAQLDSLADLSAFGIAPASVMYAFVLHRLNYEISPTLVIPTGMFLSAIYPACAAYRLARFNVSHRSDSFSGLPSPVAGAIVALMPIAFGELIPAPEAVLTLIFVAMAFLMVSTIRYSKPQSSWLRRFSPARLAIVLLFLAAVLIFVGFRYGSDYSAAGLFTIVVIYVVTGIVSLIIHAIQVYRV
ncbi:MAG: CDP-diacylglycerol--serine O-phosphatidyltransferase [Leptospirales bacterium]|nr:CDP-diacylglycerol--serine O-phosphatidyltransferase [Leptospirales bacterium]